MSWKTKIAKTEEVASVVSISTMPASKDSLGEIQFGTLQLKGQTFPVTIVRKSEINIDGVSIYNVPYSIKVQLPDVGYLDAADQSDPPLAMHMATMPR